MNVQMKNDQVLLGRYLQGDRSAISTLIAQHNSRVRDYIRTMVGDADLAADIAQETFIKAVAVIDEGRYNDSGKFLPWVLRIAHNKVIDHFRHTRNTTLVSESSAGYNLLGTMRFSEPNAEERMEGLQVEGQIRSLVEALPDDQREVVQLRYFAGLSFKEIAEQTNVGINTALGRMRYALINLRKMIKEQKLALA